MLPGIHLLNKACVRRGPESAVLLVSSGKVDTAVKKGGRGVVYSLGQGRKWLDSKLLWRVGSLNTEYAGQAGIRIGSSDADQPFRSFYGTAVGYWAGK